MAITTAKEDLVNTLALHFAFIIQALGYENCTEKCGRSFSEILHGLSARLDEDLISLINANLEKGGM